MRNTITVVLSVFNEEQKITSCLESVTWADEIIVVDDGSTDKTVSIAKKFTEKIYHHENKGYVEPSRNFAISKATGDWILVVDADERVPKSLATKLQEIAQETKAVGVRLPRKNIIFGKWIQHTGWWPDYNMRFFKKGSVVWSDKIHSQPSISGMMIDLGQQEDFALEHYNYDTISQFLTKLDSYTTITAQERALNKLFDWKSLLTLPMQEFLSRYFARKGYKDGLHGLVLSLLMAFYEFIICLKIWEKNKFPQVQTQDVSSGFGTAMKDIQRQVHFWDYDSKISEETKLFKKQFYRLRRKIPF